MAKQLPMDDKTRLVVAEDYRQEQGGKFTLIGVFPGNEVVVHKDPTGNAPGVLPGLVFVWWFIDGEGKFSSRVKLKDPSGQVLAQTDGTVEKFPKGDMLLAVKVMPFPLSQGGFVCEIDLDGRIYSRELTMRLSEAPV